jgi:hypothetical protein
MKDWILRNLNSVLISCVAFLTPIKPLMITIGILVAVDFIFGIYRAWKTKQEITSRKMSHTVTKMLLYNLTVISIWAIEKNITGSDIPITKISAGIICLVEFKSIDETFKLLFGFSIWTKMKKALGRGESFTK